LASRAKSLNILLAGEQTDEAKGADTIVLKGHIEVRGEAHSIHERDKIISTIRENSGGRQVLNFMTVKKDDPVKRRAHGFF